MMDIIGELLTWVQLHEGQMHSLAAFSEDIATIAASARALTWVVRSQKPKNIAKRPSGPQQPHP